MRDPHLVTYSEAAELLDTKRTAVSELVKSLKLTPKPMRLAGRAKGLDQGDLNKIAKAMGKPAPKIGGRIPRAMSA